MAIADPVIELDNAIATARLLADQIGAPRPAIHERYELRRTLGRGAHGLVCEAHDRHLQRSVALKLLPLQGPRSAEYAVREARTLAQFDHPNIVRIFDVGQADEVADHKVDLVYVVMELLKGTNLRTWSAAGPGLTRVREVFLAAGEGLAAAHERGFVHGDFKPENVVIDEHGRVRVVDFGLARFGGGETPGGMPTASQQTLTQGPRGTPGYIAPEVYASRIDARSDQYSFAISLWEVAIGRMPTSNDRQHDDAALPPALARLLSRACADEPSARFSSMRDLLAELSVLDLRTPSTVPPSSSPAWWVGPVAVFFAATAVVGGIVVYLSQETPPSAPLSPTTPRAATSSPGASSTSRPSIASPSTAVPSRSPSSSPSTAAPSSAPVPASARAPSRTPPTSPSAPGGASCPELASIAGEWSFTTSVQWAAEERYAGARGFYQIEVQPEEGCQGIFLVRKHGDSGLPTYKSLWQDRVVATVAREGDGAIAVTLDTWLGKNRALDGTDTAREGLHYVYSLRWRDDQLTGDWQMNDSATASPVMRGALTGARGTSQG